MQAHDPDQVKFIERCTGHATDLGLKRFERSPREGAKAFNRDDANALVQQTVEWNQVGRRYAYFPAPDERAQHISVHGKVWEDVAEQFKGKTDLNSPPKSRRRIARTLPRARCVFPTRRLSLRIPNQWRNRS
jgi:hypothetical protein